MTGWQAILLFAAGVATCWLIFRGATWLDRYEDDLDRHYLLRILRDLEEPEVPLEWLDDLDAIKRLPEAAVAPFDWEAA